MNEMKEEINSSKKMVTEWVKGSEAIFTRVNAFKAAINDKMGQIEKRVSYMAGEQSYQYCCYY